MALEYVNRRGDRYYVLQGTTKSGKPKYYCAGKAQGVPVDTLPPEYEIREDPRNGLVTIRKVRPSQILPSEWELCQEQVKTLCLGTACIVDREVQHLVVYTANSSFAQIDAFLEQLGGRMGRNWMAQQIPYSPMLRFTLVDTEPRLFAVDRWCCRGTIDRWIPLEGGRPLADQLQKYIPHLDSDSFFNLM
ncbi:MAG: hypothetical protein JSS02_13970 [Planctomycetes bacterium]|nr:hypothetical protein [Planctomycetota bacterium]